MIRLSTRAAAAALALVVCLAPAHAQADKPDKPGKPDVKPAAGEERQVKQMVIENGPNRTVHYFSSKGFDAGEESALRNLEQAENALAAAGRLAELRGLYLRNEITLERRRGVVNPLLYGYTSEYGSESFSGGFASYPYGYPYYPYGFGGFGNFGYSWGGSSSSYVVNSIAPGIGNEGVIKNELARTLADPAASEAYARAARDHDAAVASIADTKLGKEIGIAGGGGLKGRRLTLVMKKGDPIGGNLVSEDPEWITVETDKEEVRVRKADVDRITYPKVTGKPAANK